MSGNDVDDCEPIVIDNGSWMCKAGFAGDKTARMYEQTLIGRSLGEAHGEFVGEKAVAKRESLDLINLMVRGEVRRWEDMERFFEYIFKSELRTSLQDKHILITEVPFNSQQNRQKLVEIFMEKFGVSGMYIVEPASLALFSSGRTSGIVLDIGGDVTHVSALIKGTQLQIDNPARRLNFGGNDVTRYLAALLERQGVDFKSYSSVLETEVYKQHLCSRDPKCNQSEDTFTLPCGACFKVEDSHLNIMDTVLDPSLMGNGNKAADDILYGIISTCDQLTRRILTQNIILSGGGTYYRDVAEKMAGKLTSRGLDSDMKIIAPPERRKSSWLGGSVIASLDEFPTKMCKSRQSYHENGWMEFLTFNTSQTIREA